MSGDLPKVTQGQGQCQCPLMTLRTFLPYGAILCCEFDSTIHLDTVDCISWVAQCQGQVTDPKHRPAALAARPENVTSWPFSDPAEAVTGQNGSN